jgi:hypothetical protein
VPCARIGKPFNPRVPVLVFESQESERFSHGVPYIAPHSYEAGEYCFSYLICQEAEKRTVGDRIFLSDGIVKRWACHRSSCGTPQLLDYPLHPVPKRHIRESLSCC